ncbi:hypothetical protein AOQ84DRAFT_383349 [Glonium stellatum]|uniref:Uncharacterized protein n=1 Tax=Glonium stellatum TaxID=574774 RepID=A0A8E2ENM2_9PEZI|nr:hypothetical protein AOQ84DRAFT_383349 [Glonium stellatum]
MTSTFNTIALRNRAVMAPKRVMKKTTVKTSTYQAAKPGKRVEKAIEETEEAETDEESAASQASDDVDVSKVIDNMVKNVSLVFFLSHCSFPDFAFYEAACIQ